MQADKYLPPILTHNGKRGNITGALRDISFLQLCCWRFKCSGIWCHYRWANCSQYM